MNLEDRIIFTLFIIAVLAYGVAVWRIFYAKIKPEEHDFEDNTNTLKGVQGRINMSKKIELTDENLQKTYDEGCTQTKEILRKLFPKEFEGGIDLSKIQIKDFLLEGWIWIGIEGTCVLQIFQDGTFRRAKYVSKKHGFQLDNEERVIERAHDYSKRSTISEFTKE